MEGGGRAVITAVGVNSQTGVIMSLLGVAKEGTDNNGSSVKRPANGQTSQSNNNNNHSIPQQGVKIQECWYLFQIAIFNSESI